MIATKRGMPFVGAAVVAAMALAGCTNSAPVVQNNIGQPQNLTPIQNSSVSSTALPPLAGSQPGTAQISPGLSGTPVLGGAPAPTYGDPTMTTANADGSFVTLNDVGTTTPSATGRDLSGGLTYEKLLGGWNVVSGASTCRLNLTYTAKTGTSRYRASAPACQITGLANVASWSIVGQGVQLFDEGGAIIAALQLSGNRFIGTVAGGAAISMAA
jgi:hypothetical protein